MDNLKREYNKLLERGIRYSELPKETQEKYGSVFMEILDRMDAIIIELGFDNCTRSDILDGFQISGGDK
jgi:hypothetical protein